jgi:hypothetical protein
VLAADTGRTALLRLTALLAVAALALTATASGALTPSQYRARLGTICEKVEAQTKALGNGQPMSRTQIVQFLAARLGVMRQEYMSLRALQPVGCTNSILLQIRTSGVATELMHPTGARTPCSGAAAPPGLMRVRALPSPHVEDRLQRLATPARCRVRDRNWAR